MSSPDHVRRDGSTAADGWSAVITPEDAGWGFSSLRILHLQPGLGFGFETGDDEMLALPLSGSLHVRCGDEEIALTGRRDVFSGVTDFAYLPIHSTITVVSVSGGSFAFPGARATRALPFRYAPAAGVPVELRGAGTASRQVNNFATPQAFETDKLIACEVLTPGGNWSSYPPHRHDRTSAQESELEEIYWFRLRTDSGTERAEPAAAPIGYQRVYGDAERPIDVLEEVCDGDAVLVPHGWHGPSMAVPGYDMYYLNVMAGPEPVRAWKICDDPAHGWIRGTWESQPVDPRLPFYGAPEADEAAPEGVTA